MGLVEADLVVVAERHSVELLRPGRVVVLVDTQIPVERAAPQMPALVFPGAEEWLESGALRCWIRLAEPAAAVALGLVG